MGYYIQGPAKGKAEYICTELGGEIVTHERAAEAVHDPTYGVIVVLDNGGFEAAGFAYSVQEFREFTDPRDHRPKKYVLLPRSVVEELTGFSR